MILAVSPGDAAAIYTCVRERARELRRDAQAGVDAPNDLYEQANDLDRLARDLRVQIMNGPEVEARGCSCGQADYGTPGHDGGPEL